MGRVKSVSKWQKFRFYLINYLEHSSLHGVWHLTRGKKNHVVEKIFWTIVLVSIILFAISNIASVWNRFLYNSTVITIDRDYLKRNVTFPPLTLCLRDRLNETAMLDEFSKEFNKSQTLDEDFRKFLWSLAHFNISNLSDLINIKRNYFNMEDYLDVMMKISNKFPHNIILTSAANEENLFHVEPILIDELGLCYTFNSKISPLLAPRFIRDGKLNDSSIQSMELEEVNYFDKDPSATASNLSHNVDIYYHGPFDFPSESKRILNEDAKQMSYISLKFAPLTIKSDEKIRQNLFEFQRKCKFASEGNPLSSFQQQIYSQDLCRYECRVKKFLEICKCIPFFYKKESSDRLCNKSELKCIVHNKAIIDSLRADVDCGCLKDCDEIKFLLQSTETMFWFHKSRVSWTLSQSKVIYKRELIHGIIEALILTGGSLSLFIGMSCLSLIEIGFFIYLFLRNK